jgi:hypothetical protein
LVPLLILTNAAAQESDYPRVFLSWADSGLEVASVESHRSLPLPGQETLEPARRDQKLVVVQITGTAPAAGYLTIYPTTFGVAYLHRGRNALVMSRAWGQKWQDPDTGKPIEIWHTDPTQRVNLGKAQGEKIKLFFVCDIPKDVSEVRAIVPKILEPPVKVE